MLSDGGSSLCHCSLGPWPCLRCASAECNLYLSSGTRCVNVGVSTCCYAALSNTLHPKDSDPVHPNLEQGLEFAFSTWECSGCQIALSLRKTKYPQIHKDLQAGVPGRTGWVSLQMSAQAQIVFLCSEVLLVYMASEVLRATPTQPGVRNGWGQCYVKVELCSSVMRYM